MTETRLVLILGAGGHGRDIRAIMRDLKKDFGFFEYQFLGFLDDDPSKETLGPFDRYTFFMSNWGDKLSYVIGLNDPAERRRVANYMDSIHAKPATLVHSTAFVGPQCYVGSGSVLGPQSALTTNVNIGRHVHLNTGASINQGSVLGDYCTLSPGVRVCGDVKVGHTTYLGANSTVINMKNIGNNVTVGAGGVVVKDIENDVVAVGVPAKVIKQKALV